MVHKTGLIGLNFSQFRHHERLDTVNRWEVGTLSYTNGLLNYSNLVRRHQAQSIISQYLLMLIQNFGCVYTGSQQALLRWLFFTYLNIFLWIIKSEATWAAQAHPKKSLHIHQCALLSWLANTNQSKAYFVQAHAWPSKISKDRKGMGPHATCQLH